MEIVNKYLTVIATEPVELGELRVTINLTRDGKKLINISGSLVDAEQKDLGVFFYSTALHDDVLFQINDTKEEYIDVIYKAVHKIISELSTLDI